MSELSCYSVEILILWEYIAYYVQFFYIIKQQVDFVKSL